MEKWKQVAMDAAVDPAARDLISDKIEQLFFFFDFFQSFWCFSQLIPLLAPVRSAKSLALIF